MDPLMAFRVAALTAILFALSLRVWAADGRNARRLTGPHDAVAAGTTLGPPSLSGAPRFEAPSDKGGRWSNPFRR